jgi:hypothetical protein
VQFGLRIKRNAPDGNGCAAKTDKDAPGSRSDAARVKSRRWRVGISWLGFMKWRSAVVNGSVSTKSPTLNRDVGTEKIEIPFDRRTK